MNPQNIIDQFFLPKRDKELTKDQKFRRSVLLALKEDLAFNIQLPGKFRKLQLQKDQYKELQKMLPTFSIISLFCTSVDVLARVYKKRTPKSGETSKFFRSCAKKWFKLTSAQAKQLWNLRNGISHSYRLYHKQVVEQFGHTSVIRKSPKGYYYFYLHAMYSQFCKVIEEIYSYLSNQSENTKMKTAKYLEKNGFFFTS